MRSPLGDWINSRLRGRIGIGLVLLSATGCLHTWTGASFYFPPGSSAPDAEYRLAIQFDGAAGRSYLERTKKEIGLAIRKGNAVLLSRHYTLVAGDLDAGATWKTADDLTIFFFEPGVYAPRTAARTELLRLHFTMDQHGSFVEAPLSPADLAMLKLPKQ